MSHSDGNLVSSQSEYTQSWSSAYISLAPAYLSLYKIVSATLFYSDMKSL